MSDFEQAKTHATLNGKKIAGTLKECRIVSFGAYSIAYGLIYGDNRWSDGTEIRTSAVVKYSPEHCYIETNNSLYLINGEVKKLDWVKK